MRNIAVPELVRPRACFECRHFIGSVFDAAFSRCGASDRFDPVTGKHEHYHCETERGPFANSCGPEGKNFEARK